MKFTTAARRFACTATVLAGGAFALAGSAQAATYTIPPADTVAFVAAVDAANTSLEADTIQLSGGVYSPEATVTVTDDLVIRGNPAFQAAPDPIITLNGAAVEPLESNFVVVAEGANLTLQAVNMTGGFGEFPNLLVQGNLRVENSAISGSTGDGVATDSLATAPTATIVNSSIIGNTRYGVSVSPNGIVNINNSTFTQNSLGGVTSDGVANITNSIVALNGFANCNGFGTITFNSSSDTDVDGDGLGDCVNFDPAGTGNITTANTNAGVGLAPFLTTNGGPTRTRALTETSPSRNSANNAICPRVDQRYFVRTDGSCDRGSYELNAVRDQTAPTCVVTAVRNGPPKEQDVTVQDPDSGLDLIDNVAITNGTVANPSFSYGTLSPVVVTATKTDQTQLTRWSFDARDVAGNVRDCR